MTKCKHHVDERPGVSCAFCQPCRFHDWPVQATCPKCAGSDEYGPVKQYTKEDVEAYGAQFWYAATKFWSDKFFELSADMSKVQKGEEL